ncbi:MAG: hypothetical protein ACK5B5_03000 [Bacteroidota bacterium]|jgi:hypothetical protein
MKIKIFSKGTRVVHRQIPVIGFTGWVCSLPLRRNDGNDASGGVPVLAKKK